MGLCFPADAERSVKWVYRSRSLCSFFFCWYNLCGLFHDWILQDCHLGVVSVVWSNCDLRCFCNGSCQKRKKPFENLGNPFLEVVFLFQRSEILLFILWFFSDFLIILWTHWDFYTSYHWVLDWIQYLSLLVLIVPHSYMVAEFLINLSHIKILI